MARLAREAKALCASACVWAGLRGGDETPGYQVLLDSAVRACDPFVALRKRWIVRRLAPYCSRVDLSMLPKQRDEERLLAAMGFELANVHLGTARLQKPILADLKSRGKRWLHKAAEQMKSSLDEDFAAWKSRKPA